MYVGALFVECKSAKGGTTTRLQFLGMLSNISEQYMVACALHVACSVSIGPARCGDGTESQPSHNDRVGGPSWGIAADDQCVKAIDWD